MKIELDKTYTLESKIGTLKFIPMSIDGDRLYVKIIEPQSMHTVFSLKQVENHPALKEFTNE